MVLGLLDRLAHMREARDNARTEVERLTGQIEAAKRIGLAHLGRPWANVLNDVLRAVLRTPIITAHCGERWRGLRPAGVSQLKPLSLTDPAASPPLVAQACVMPIRKS